MKSTTKSKQGKGKSKSTIPVAHAATYQEDVQKGKELLAFFYPISN